MTLTKADIVETVRETTGFTETKSVRLVEAIVEFIKKSLESGEDVLISRFGKFCVSAKKQRKGRNPATGDDIVLDARRVVTFRCSPVLRERLNGRE